LTKGPSLVRLSRETDQTKEAQAMIPQYELKAEDIRAYTMNLLKGHTQLDASGYICTTDLILDVILKASAEGSSIEAASNDLEDAADSNTIREYLNAALDIQALREQEREMNAALAECCAGYLAHPSEFLGNGDAKSLKIGYHTGQS